MACGGCGKNRGPVKPAASARSPAYKITASVGNPRVLIQRNLNSKKIRTITVKGKPQGHKVSPQGVKKARSDDVDKYRK